MANPDTFLWPSHGIEPPTPEDAQYYAGEQPIAGFDNYINRLLTEDIHWLYDHSQSHAAEHEAGGSQPINLAGLSVGSAGTLAAGENTVGFADTTGAQPVSIDLPNDVVNEWPRFGTQTTHSSGLAVGHDIEREGGATLYDYNDDRFHRAYQADEANWADAAGDADTLQGLGPGAFLQPADDAVISGNWEFGPTVDADISGNARTADRADSAAHADEADLAALAQDSNHLEGNTTQDILDMVDAGLIDGVAPDVQDDGQTKLADAEALSFDNSIDVSTSGDTAHMSVDSVPHAQEANYAYDSDKVDGYHAQEIIDLASSSGGDEGRWVPIDEWQVGGENSTIDWDVDVQNDYGNTWDFYKIVLVHENCSTSSTAWKSFKFNLNYDFRFRYDYSKEVDVTSSTSSTSVSLSTSIGTSINISKSINYEKSYGYWPLCPCKPNQRAVAEYTVANPTPITSGVENKPQIAVQHFNGSPDADDVLHNGELGTNFDDIHAFSLESDHDAAAYIQLWGSDINIA